jgi:UPF0755 protein
MSTRYLWLLGIAITLGIVSYVTFAFFLDTPNTITPITFPTTGTTATSTASSSTSATSTASTSPTQSTPPVATSSTTTPPGITPPVADDPALERFVVPFGSTSTDTVADKLLNEGFIKNKTTFSLAYAARGGGLIAPGGYKLSKEMSAFEVAGVLHGKPYMKWIQIPEGLRKEEIATILARELGWTSAQKSAWITTYTNMQFDYREGVYFPDTYLIPIDEAPLDVAQRLIAKFNEKFNPYLPEFNAQNIKWSTGLTFASIVQREAAGKSDMPLIAGILWNRLENNMYLGVDATLQYARGDTGTGWWAPIKASEKNIDSPFNTYTNKGLPPHAISNPGLTAIEATLHPATTDCLYYLHDKNHEIHCAVTYEEHQANIQKYLVENQ